MDYQTETVSRDEIVYDFPERSLSFRIDGREQENIQSYGLDPVELDDVEIEIEEKRAILRGDFVVQFSFAVYEEGGRDEYRLEMLQTE
jgi:hypothetical protein